MKSRVIALGVGGALALLCGVEALGTSAFADDREGSGLPDGAKLLKSDDTECDGVLMASGLKSDQAAERIKEGDKRTFKVDGQNVPWTCLGKEGSRSGTMECPERTTHVRITHDANVAKFECYGRKG
jgi:hypothetical protein